MKRLFFFCLLILALTACGGVDLDKKIGENPIIAASPIAEDLVQYVQPSATMAPTRTLVPFATPTINYYETTGVLQVKLQMQVGTSTMAAVTEQSVVKTLTALQGYTDATALATVALGNRKQTATAAVTQTAEMQAVQTAWAAATGTVQAPITQRLQVEADWAPFWQTLLFGGALLLVLLVLFYGVQIGYQWLQLLYDERMALRGSVEQPEPVIDTLGVKLDRRDAYGWGSVDFTALPIDRKTLREVAELLTNGARYTQAQMTGAGRPLVKDGTYDTFGDWMCRYAIAAKVDSRYSIIHLEFFKQVLAG